MTLTWPFALVTAVAVPLLLAVYLRQLRRRRATAIRFPDVALLRAAAPRRAAWRRHVPVGLLLGALGVLAIAAARPQLRTEVPLQRTAIILAIDVSRSMCATDVPPNRLTAAQQAMRTFIRDQPDDTRIGIVAFAGFAELAVAPTTDRGRLVGAVDALSTGRGTTIGAAILKSVDAIAAINPDVRPVGLDAEETTPGRPGTPTATAPAPPVADIVVLLTDGANTRGVTPVRAAEVAAGRGVRVYPIGFGTTNPTSMVCSVEQLGADALADVGGPVRGALPDGAGGPGGPGGPGGFGRFLLVDEPTLRTVAQTTGATYHNARDQDQLAEVLRNLPREIVLATQDVEVTAALAGLAVALVLAGIALSVRWGVFP